MHTNRIFIILFCIVVLLIIITTSSFQKFYTHFIKSDSEIYARVNYLSKLHKSFHDTYINQSIIRFIYPMDYKKRKESYFNNFDSLSSFYSNYYWVYEKGNEFYGLDNSNIFKINEFTSIFLLNQGINLNDICKKINNNYTGKLVSSKNVLFYNEDSLKSANHIIKLNYKFMTNNPFSTLKIFNSNDEVIARSEVDLANKLNPSILSFSNKIINSNNNLILLDVVSKSPSGQLLETSEIEIVLFKTNDDKLKIEFEFYNNKDEFYKFSDIDFNHLEYEIKSINKKYLFIEKNQKTINCKS